MNLMTAIQSDLPLYLSPADYDSIQNLFTPGKINQQLTWDYNKLVSPEGIALKQIIQTDPAGISWLGIKKLQRLQVGDQFELYDGYIMTKDHRHLLFFITPANPANATGKNREFLLQLDAIIDSLQKQFPKIDASYFGAVAVSVVRVAIASCELRTHCSRKAVHGAAYISIALLSQEAGAIGNNDTGCFWRTVFALSAIIYLIKGHISVVALGAGSIVL